MTNRDFFNAVITANVNDELTAFAKAEIAKLDARNDKRRNTLTKEQKENEVIKESILGVLNGVTTAAEVGKTLEISTQKASALLGQLAFDEKVIVTEVKIKGKGTVRGYRKA